MTPDFENWEQLQALFHLAEGTPDNELEAVLLKACTDPELRQRTMRLIKAGRERISDAPPGAPVLHSRIGSYTVLRHLGAGGIGTVYLVERVVGGAVQRAALKTLSNSAAGPFFTERFAREQHILASLDHPNITRMLDAGVSEAGQPYLVMEFVDGVHLDAYCDARSLGVPARLQLFVRVCEAVAYAHRNLVVHLDLKPSNILVTDADGTVKVLDFGTSKVILPDSLLTTTVMATPAYASPEQLRNEPVTTVCDVYALGAILFELLAGRRPNQDCSVALMIERSMKELPPEPVADAVTSVAAEHRGLTQTRLRSLLSGDLSTIVAKCLTPRPKDRYASVDALIADVQRYLVGRPILARPQTTTYRISKFVRRNRVPVLAVALACLALTASLGYAAWRQHEALLAGQRALRMQSFMSQLFKLANSNYTGKPAATVPEFLQLGVKILPDLLTDPGDQRAARLSLAESMFENHDYVHAQPVFSDVIASAKAAADTNSEVEAEGYAGDVAYLLGQADLSRSLESHALSLAHASGVAPSTRVAIEEFFANDQESSGFRTPETLRLLEAAASESRSAQLPPRQQANAMANLAGSLSFRGDADNAEAAAKAALAIYQSEPYALCDRSEVNFLLGNIRYARGDFKGSLPFLHAAEDGYITCSGPDSLNVLALEIYIARTYLKMRQAPPAILILEDVLPKERRSGGPGGANVIAPLIFLARAYVMNGDFGKAEPIIREAMKLQQGTVNPHSPQIAVGEFILAQSLAGQRRFTDALVQVEMADSIYSSIPTLTPSETEYASQAHALLLDLRSKVPALGAVLGSSGKKNN